MRLFGIALLVLLLSGCTEAGTDVETSEAPEETLGAEDRAEREGAEPFSFEMEGTLIGAGVCSESESRFVGASTFVQEFQVPRGTETFHVDLAWDIPASVCLMLHNDSVHHFIQTDPASLSTSLETELEASSGEWLVSVWSFGPGPVAYSLRIEGS